jgi:LPS-assembly lipoprotein
MRWSRLRIDGCARVLAMAAFAACVAACGFHPRGEASYPFQTLYLNSPGTLPFTTDLRRALEATGSAKLMPTADKAQVVLDVNSVDDDKHILSLCSGGKVFEFLLTKRVMFRVHDAEGNDWLPTSEVVVRRRIPTAIPRRSPSTRSSACGATCSRRRSSRPAHAGVQETRGVAPRCRSRPPSSRRGSFHFRRSISSMATSRCSPSRPAT